MPQVRRRGSAKQNYLLIMEPSQFSNEIKKSQATDRPKMNLSSFAMDWDVGPARDKVLETLKEINASYNKESSNAIRS